MLVTFDVDGLYTNIVHEEGLQCMREQLQERTAPQVPTEYLLSLMDIILNENIFVFYDSLWKQKVGAAMGSKPVPHYANVFLARTIDKAFKILSSKYDTETVKALQLLKRFLDDYFSIFVGTTKDLHKLLKEINLINPTINLTMNHTSIQGEDSKDKCECKEQSSIPFLDTLCYIKEGRIETDLYKKQTDRNQYLLPSSCHPKQTTKSIPYSLGLRIVRICSEPINREIRLEELKVSLMKRDHKEENIDTSLRRAKRVPRELALRRVAKPNQSQRPVFALTYDPRLPSIGSLQAKHWRSMKTRDQHLANVFPSPPLTAFRRQPNIRSFIIRAAVAKPKGRYPERSKKGMKKCQKENCTACPFIVEGKTVIINKKSWRIEKQVSCLTYNCVYAIFCQKENCKSVCIGETKRLLKFRLADHRGYVTNRDTTTATPFYPARSQH
jgi:hypothetical protein